MITGSAEYRELHYAVEAAHGKARLRPCTYADESCSLIVEWANISHQYIDVNDFMPLCQSHHFRYDDTPERRAACSAAATGHVKTLEHRAALSVNLLGV